MKDILNSYTASELKKEISKTNIKGYSALTKPQLIERMMKPVNINKFMHLKMKEKKPRAKPKPRAKKEPVKKEKRPFIQLTSFDEPDKKPAEKPKKKEEKFFYSENKIEEANADIKKGQKFYDYIAKLMKQFNKSPNKKLKKEIEHYIKSIKKKPFLDMDEFTLEMEGVTDNYVDVFKKYKSTKKKLKSKK